MTGIVGNSYLLDTNIVIPILNRESQFAEKLVGNTTYISSIVLGELYFGAKKSQLIQQNIAKINQFVVNFPILDCDRTIAFGYGQIKADLRQKGKPIPEDIWIAAQALQHNLILVSRDEHFNNILNLNVEKW